MTNFSTNNQYLHQVKKIYASLKEDYPGSWQSITTLSKNFAEHKDFIICNYKAFNFDHVNNPGTVAGIKEKTPDALFLQNDIFYFVEFKAGRNVNRANIRQKIHEGINMLYQYCAIKRLATREEFIHFRFKYAVIDKQEDVARGRVTFVNALRSSAQHYSLKNLEGLLVEQTRVCSTPESTFEFFRKISQGTISSLLYVERNGRKVRLPMAPAHDEL